MMMSLYGGTESSAVTLHPKQKAKPRGSSLECTLPPVCIPHKMLQSGVGR